MYILVLHIRANRGRAPGNLYGESAPGVDTSIQNEC